MKTQYDFSKGERGKFYRVDAVLSLPIYLAPDVGDFLNEVAAQKRVDVQDLVNDWLRKDMELIQSARADDEQLPESGGRCRASASMLARNTRPALLKTQLTDLLLASSMRACT